MKKRKIYKSPTFYFENYELSRSIATSCNADVTNSLLAAAFFSETIQTTSTCALDYDTYAALGVVETYCYWDGEIQLFTS